MMKYSELMTTTEVAFCGLCSEYKTMVDCTECGATFCVTCDDWCPVCGETIDWSA